MIYEELIDRIDREIDIKDQQGWTMLIKILYDSRDHKNLDKLVDYAEVQLSSWPDESRAQMTNNFHFKSYYELSPVIKLLRQLKMSRKTEEWGSRYINLLSETSYVEQLKSLSIVSCELYPGTLSKLFDSSNFKRLENLSIKNTLAKKGEIEALLDSKMLDKLTVLELTNQKINDQWVAAFLNRKDLPKLKLLNLSYNQITDSGALKLAQSKPWQGLKELNLKRNRITAYGKQTLLDSSHFPDKVNFQF